MNDNFGDILKEMRTTRGMTQDELAVLLNTSKQVISRYETGQRFPKITVAQEYATKLGVPLGRLLGSPDIEEKPTTVSDDGLWASICEDKTKLMLARWISSLNTDQLEMVVGLLEAARLTPEK